MEHHLQGYLSPEVIGSLKAGDIVYYSGTIVTARDEVHRRLIQMLDEKKPLPINLSKIIIFYAGPSPTPPGRSSGVIGPTTSIRMDRASIQLIEAGLKVMIGKGNRSQAMIDQMMKHSAVYLGAIGGSAAVLAKSVITSKVIAFEELGPEAIRELEVKNFPLICLIDATGNNLYELGPNAYLDGESL